MWAALSETFYAQVVASLAIVLAAILPPTILTIRKQNKVHEDNRADHQATATIVKEMHDDLLYVKQDMGLMKQDVSQIKTDLTKQAVRITDLEGDLAKAPDPAMLPTISTGE